LTRSTCVTKKHLVRQEGDVLGSLSTLHSGRCWCQFGRGYLRASLLSSSLQRSLFVNSSSLVRWSSSRSTRMLSPPHGSGFLSFVGISQAHAPIRCGGSLLEMEANETDPHWSASVALPFSLPRPVPRRRIVTSTFSLAYPLACCTDRSPAWHRLLWLSNNYRQSGSVDPLAWDGGVRQKQAEHHSDGPNYGWPLSAITTRLIVGSHSWQS
jgi:hypothetical protein